MSKSRRKFLGTSLAMGLAPILKPGVKANHIPTNKSEKGLKILILGGTSFLGPHQISYALDRGHEVSIFTRGKTEPKVNKEVFSKVEKLVGDRGR